MRRVTHAEPRTRHRFAYQFQAADGEYLARLHKSGEPVVLTVNGKAQVVVQDAAAYQKLVETAAKVDREETMAAIREGLADMKAGRSKPARRL